MSSVQNIFITGGTGYIGGSILAYLLSHADLITGARLHAAVRSESQAQALSKLNVNVLKFELDDKIAVENAVEQSQIDLIIHAANSSDPLLVTNLVEALGKRRAATGKPAYIIHSSVTTLFSEEAGWPYGLLKDSDSIYEKEVELGGPHPVRETNLLLVEKARECGVTSFNIVVPNVYGRGTGEWRKVSILIPALIQASIKLHKVYKFDKDGHPPAAHISDVVALYGILVGKILRDQDMPNGKDGYYFAMAHRAPWWAYMEALAKSLHARGLVASSELETWPSDAEAAEALHFPAQFIRAMGTASGGLEPVNAYSLGWQPSWDEKAFLENADEEVQTVLDLDTIRSSLFDKLVPDVSG